MIRRPFARSIELAQALRAQHVELEELVFADEIHAFREHRHWLAAYHAATDFLARHLETPRAPSPAKTP